MDLVSLLQNLERNRGALREAARVKNASVLRSLLGPAWRGFLRQAAKGRPGTDLGVAKRYEINDNLCVIVDALMSDSRWDVKFLGMQILIEGLALLAYEDLPSAPELTADDLLRD